MLSKQRAKDRNADDRVEDGYKDTLISKKNQTPVEKGYEADYLCPSKPCLSKVPLQSSIEGKIFRKTNKCINANPF